MSELSRSLQALRSQQARAMSASEFRRHYGVKRATFEAMVQQVEQHQAQKKKSGRPSDLSLPAQVLFTLEYWREHRTYFHHARDWGLHESNAIRIVGRIEEALLTSKKFHLPGKKTLICSDVQWHAVVVDVTECPIEKPKKSRESTTVARESTLRSKCSSL